MPPENSLLFYAALRKHKVPAELHIFEKGTHGKGLGTGERNPGGGFSSWPELCIKWMQGRGLLKP